MHQTHSFKNTKNDLKKNFVRISLLFVITFVQGDYCTTKMSLGRPLERSLCTQRPSECGGHLRLMEVTHREVLIQRI